VNSLDFSGMSGGVYGGYASGPFFIDGAINANGVVMRSAVPALGLGADATIDTNVVSLGGQVDGGMRLGLGEQAFIEPLLSLSYVRISADDAFVRASQDPTLPGDTLSWDDATSLRGGAGARLGFGHEIGAVALRYTLLGRIWNEFEGENGLVVRNAGPDAP